MSILIVTQRSEAAAPRSAESGKARGLASTSLSGRLQPQRRRPNPPPLRWGLQLLSSCDMAPQSGLFPPDQAIAASRGRSGICDPAPAVIDGSHPNPNPSASPLADPAIFRRLCCARRRSYLRRLRTIRLAIHRRRPDLAVRECGLALASWRAARSLLDSVGSAAGVGSTHPDPPRRRWRLPASASERRRPRRPERPSRGLQHPRGGAPFR